MRNSATTSYPTTGSELSIVDETRTTLDPSSTPSEPGVVVGGQWPSQSTPATTTPQDATVTTETDEQSPSTSRMSATEAAYVTTDNASGSPQSTSVYDSKRTSTPERTTTDLPESTTSSGRYSTPTETIDVTTGSTTAPITTELQDITTGQFSTQGRPTTLRSSIFQCHIHCHYTRIVYVNHFFSMICQQQSLSSMIKLSAVSRYWLRRLL